MIELLSIPTSATVTLSAPETPAGGDGELAGAVLGDAEAHAAGLVAEEERCVGEADLGDLGVGTVVCSKKKSPPSFWPAIVSVTPLPPTRRKLPASTLSWEVTPPTVTGRSIATSPC